jgi:hypothetical protein
MRVVILHSQSQLQFPTVSHSARLKRVTVCDAKHRPPKHLDELTTTPILA